LQWTHNAILVDDWTEDHFSLVNFIHPPSTIISHQYLGLFQAVTSNY
jgi:hypothetical protein